METKIDWKKERKTIIKLLEYGMSIEKLAAKYEKTPKQMQSALSRQKISIQNIKKQIKIKKQLSELY